MTDQILLSLSYVIPSAIIALMALQVAGALGGLFTGLKAKAAEQELPVPPLVRVYFRATMRTLYVTGFLHIFALSGDLTFALISPARLTAQILGFSSTVLLLVCGFTLLLQGGVDRQLKLFSTRMRIAQSLGGVAGIAAACWGIVLITWRGSVWLS